MTEFATNELWSVFDARRVKAPELKGLDAQANSFIGFFKNRRRVLKRLKQQAKRIDKLEPEIRALGSVPFQEEVAELRALPASTDWLAMRWIARWPSSAKGRFALWECARSPCS